VDVDVRRVTRVVVGLCLVSLFVSAAVLFVAGFHDNAQMNELRTDGVPVEITVAKCLGLLGGSGSNQAGYACTGSFTVDGHRYVEPIPGDVLLAPGTRIAGIASSRDPSLFTTAAVAARQHASFNVYITPVVLLAAFLLIVVGLARSGRLTASGQVRRADEVGGV
jgi:hypothetical protein